VVNLTREKLAKKISYFKSGGVYCYGNTFGAVTSAPTLNSRQNGEETGDDSSPPLQIRSAGNMGSHPHSQCVDKIQRAKGYGVNL